jgi:ethanolamine ammonia-lyase small subunit
MRGFSNSLKAMADRSLQPADLLAAVRARTPARLLVGRAGSGYRTATHLALRLDHAAARDAVHAELAIPADLVERFEVFEVATQATAKSEYLLRPDLGRRFSESAREQITRNGTPGCDLQVVIGDGLSATAVAAQVPGLLLLLADGARQRNWSFGRPFAVRYCRVGVLNDVGELLDPVVVVLLVGERPGLATAESLSAYLAYRPRSGHTDAQRNLISNIHARGIGHDEAAVRILALAEQLRSQRTSGVAIKERLSGSPSTLMP